MARRKAFDEDTVLEKALHLFWEQGYDATSMEDLVKRLGISRSSIYETFKDKRQLFLKALSRYRAQTGGQLIERLHTDPTPTAVLRDMLESTVQQACQDPLRKGCFMANSTVELANYDAEIATIATANKTAMVNALASAIERGQTQGAIATTFSPAQLAESFYALYNGLQVVSKFECDRERMQAAIAPMLGLLGL